MATASTVTFTICQDFLTRLNDASQTFMDDTLANIATSMTPFAKTLMIIYVCWIGYRMYFGQADLQALIPQMLKMIFVFSIVTNPTIYNQLFGEWLWRLPEALAGLVLSGKTSDTANFLDGLLAQFYSLYVAFSALAAKNSLLGMPDITAIFAGWIVLGAGIVLTMYALLIVALSKVAIAVLLAIGPIFVLMINAQATRKFFDAWIGQIMTFSFTVMLLSAIMKLVISLLQDYLTGANSLIANASTDPSVNQIVPVLMLSGVAIVMLLQIASMASSLGGGIAISTLGVGSKEIGITKAPKDAYSAYRSSASAYKSIKDKFSKNSIENGDVTSFR